MGSSSGSHPSSSVPELIARGAGPRRPLVAIGPWLPGSGYTRVLLNILARLGDAYEVHFIGTGYKGPRLQLAGATASPSHPNLQSMPFSRSPESGEGAAKGPILQSPISNLPLADDQPYAVAEFAVSVGPGYQGGLALAGNRVAWTHATWGNSDLRHLFVRDLATGQERTIATGDLLAASDNFDLDGDPLVTIEENPAFQRGIFGYRLADSSRFTILAPQESAAHPWQPRISGNTVVWVQTPGDVYAHDLAAGRTFAVAATPAMQEGAAVSGNYVIWADARNVPAASTARDLYGYDLTAAREFRITRQPEEIASPAAISGNTVVWAARRGTSYQVLAYDVAGGQERLLADLGSSTGPRGVDVDGNLVVWSASRELGFDVGGYDLASGRQLIVSRAIGDQFLPKIAGTTVVWQDARGSGIGKYEYDSDIYAARLQPGPAPAPPIVGVPAAADAKIEIVWPHGGAPVTAADRANVAAWLFQPGTLNLAPCQWLPRAQLWRAIDNEPAKVVATTSRPDGGRYFAGGRAVPTWDFNDVDVSAARNPQSKVYFFVTLEGTPARGNVWSHAADARTFFPQQHVPVGTAPAGNAVEARIEIVWPHGNAPVSQARMVNVSAALFVPGTLQSVPPDWNPTVRLLRALNQNVAEEVAVGQKRLVSQGGVIYPMWDFNDVDVSVATDPVNKYFFRLSVDGVQTYSNVWSHGADARTYFPQLDTPTAACR